MEGLIHDQMSSFDGCPSPMPWELLPTFFTESPPQSVINPPPLAQLSPNSRGHDQRTRDMSALQTLPGQRSDSWRTKQEHSPNRKQDQAAITVVTPELPKEHWDAELTFPSGLLDWEQIVNQAAATRVAKSMWVSTRSRPRMEGQPPGLCPKQTLGVWVEFQWNPLAKDQM